MIHYLFITFPFTSGKSSGDGYRMCSSVCLLSTVVNEANIYIIIVRFPMIIKMRHLISEGAQQLNSGLQNTLLV